MVLGFACLCNSHAYNVLFAPLFCELIQPPRPNAKPLLL